MAPAPRTPSFFSVLLVLLFALSVERAAATGVLPLGRWSIYQPRRARVRFWLQPPEGDRRSGARRLAVNGGHTLTRCVGEQVGAVQRHGWVLAGLGHGGAELRLGNPASPPARCPPPPRHGAHLRAPLVVRRRCAHLDSTSRGELWDWDRCKRGEGPAARRKEREGGPIFPCCVAVDPK